MNKRLIVILLCAGVIVVVGGLMLKEPSFDGYRPMVCYNNHLYGETGEKTSSLNGEWVSVGEIKKKVSAEEPMVQENFVSNWYEVGTPIYEEIGQNGKSDILYVEIEGNFCLLKRIEN